MCLCPTKRDWYKRLHFCQASLFIIGSLYFVRALVLFLIIFCTLWKLSIAKDLIQPKMHAVISLSHTMHRNSYWKIAYTVEWAIVFQFDSLSTDINLVCSCALVVVWSATFPKLSLVSSNVIVMLASKLVSTVVLKNFTIVICSSMVLRDENTFLSYMK